MPQGSAASAPHFRPVIRIRFRKQTPDRMGIVIELKYADDGKLEKACSEALKQIEEKKYAEGLKRQGMKKIMKYGIAFYEKECMAVMA